MHDLLGSVVSLTGCRDRDRIGATLVAVLADGLQPLALSLLRRVGPPEDARLLRQAGVRGGQPLEPGDPPWTPLEALTPLDDRPWHREVLERGEPRLAVAVGRDGGAPLLSLFPVWFGEERCGVVEVLTERPLGDEQRRLVTGVLTIYRHQIGLLDYSEHDTLTGLLNRKTFDDQFLKTLEAGGEAARWLGVIDIDHFKRVNDDFGHLIGDEVLLLVARLLRSSFRHDDRMYRFGGEEFVVLLRADTRAHAALAFERFRARMQGFRFPQVGAVTASVGFTRLRPLDSASGAFERADQAVYHAKQNGRNQVCCHEALVDEGVFSAVGKSGEIELF